MKQEESTMWKAAKRAGAKMELEMEKVQYLLASAQHMLQREKERDPELYEILDLLRIWREIRDARKQLENAQELAAAIGSYLTYRDRHPEAERRAGETYPAYPNGFRTVADAESSERSSGRNIVKISHKG